MTTEAHTQVDDIAEARRIVAAADDALMALPRAVEHRAVMRWAHQNTMAAHNWWRSEGRPRAEAEARGARAAWEAVRPWFDGLRLRHGWEAVGVMIENVWAWWGRSLRTAAWRRREAAEQKQRAAVELARLAVEATWARAGHAGWMEGVSMGDMWDASRAWDAADAEVKRLADLASGPLVDEARRVVRAADDRVVLRRVVDLPVIDDAPEPVRRRRM
jgi:hypothetical protein